MFTIAQEAINYLFLFRKELWDRYLGRRRRWRDGQHCKCCAQAEGVRIPLFPQNILRRVAVVASQSHKLKVSGSNPDARNKRHLQYYLILHSGSSPLKIAISLIFQLSGITNILSVIYGSMGQGLSFRTVTAETRVQVPLEPRGYFYQL